MAPAESYRDLMAKLANLPAEHAAEQARIAQWHERQLNAAQAAVERAVEVVRQAESAEAAAGATTQWTRAEARRLWRLLERLAGQLGPAPEPAPAADPEDDPLQLVRGVDELLRGTAPAKRVPSWVTPVLIGAGVVIVTGLLTLGLVVLVSGR